MANAKVITVEPDGTVRGLHYDDFDLGFLGKKTIGRASEILFNDTSQAFYVELPQLEGGSTPNFLSGFAGYDGARAFEVMLLETAAWSKVEPAFTGEFYWMASHTRDRFNKGDREPFHWQKPEGKAPCVETR